MVEGGDYCFQRPRGRYQYWCVHFQVNVSNLRRPLDTVDLEELRDSRERTRAPVLWLSCEGQINVWELFSGNSDSIAILDKDSWLQPQ